MQAKRVLTLAGDGIGPEIMQQGTRVLEAIAKKFDLPLQIETALIGGAAVDVEGQPLPESTLVAAKQSDAILLGAVGGPQWDTLPRPQRPEQGLLGIRSQLKLFANLRPALLFEPLASASSLKPEVVAGLDLLIVRELTGGIYFGQPRGVETLNDGEREGFNTYRYRESEIKRIGHVAFQAAQRRGKKLCSVDKANVLEVTGLWREVMNELAAEYPDVELTHMYVDNAAMQLVRAPKQFDVMVTGNMFGDILSDEAAMLTGSIGMLPSASLAESGLGMYEPCHGSAPDIAGQDKSNPLAMILSVAMMLRYSLQYPEAAAAIEQAVADVLTQGLRTADIAHDGDAIIGTKAMGEAVIKALN